MGVPRFARVDLGATRKLPIRGNMSIELTDDVLHVFDNVSFTLVANPGTQARARRPKRNRTQL
jgi:hypothetical protein